LSGFVALFQRNDAPVDRALVHGMTSFLSFRGPDASSTWCSGPVGMGHTLLRTTRSSANERQPMGFDGQCWIASDARLDRRDELRDELISAGRDVARSACDGELILHAYMAWSDDCVLRLRGDFSFAIWDARGRRVFCARDHFGIKPFYYAVTRDFFVCSNTLDCVRLHPNVSDELNDEAVADFLLFGLNCNKETTTFKDVQRLAPAHRLSASIEDVTTRRYWSLPVDGRIRYKRNEEYVEHFRENLRLAVADRMDADGAAIFLSGGMDSGAVAATARELAHETGTDLKAFTVTYEQLIGDREGYFAKQTADFLKIPIEILSMDHVRPFEFADAEFAMPEPLDDPLASGLYEQFGAVARHGRVVLDGEGIDNLMHFQLKPYLKDLMRRGEFGTLIGAAAGYLWKKRGRRDWLSQGRTASSARKRPALPEWIASNLARRLNLEERGSVEVLPGLSPSHPILPDAHASFELPHWARMFETSDAGLTRERIEVRYPFLDLRVVEFVLALPPYPLFLDKGLEREAMRGKLPAAALNRPKSPLTSDPAMAALGDRGREFATSWTWDPEIRRYVDVEKLSCEWPYSRTGSYCIRAACFNFWLQESRRVRYKLSVEVS
jgi:asparagine synthase (glutamine-hydrolysing)